MGLSPWFLERRENQEIFQLEFGENLIGRIVGTHIVVPSVFASRKHCTITVSQTNPDEVYLEDLGTCNGTWINTNVIKGERARLQEGDNIGIGCTTIGHHGDAKYYIFTVKRDDVPIENIIINLDDEEEEDEEEDEENVDILDCDSVEEIEDDPVEEVEFEEEQEIEKELSFSLKQEILDEIIEIEDLFSECDSNIEEDEDLFHQYKLKQELSMRDDSDIVLISDSEDEDIKEMINVNWVLKLSQNFDSKKTCRDIKQESDETNMDADILEELRRDLGKLPGDDDEDRGQGEEPIVNEQMVEDRIVEEPIVEDPIVEDQILDDEIGEYKIKIEDDDLIQITDPTPSPSLEIVEEKEISKPSSLEIPPISLRRCSVVLERMSIETRLDSDNKQESDSDEEVKPPRKKIRRILSVSNKELFGPDEDEGDNAKEINKKKSKRHTTKYTGDKKPTSSKGNDKIKNRKISHDDDERTNSRSRSREKIVGSEPGSSKTSKSDEESKSKRKQHQSSSRKEGRSNFESKSKHDLPKEDVREKVNKKVRSEPEHDSDFIDKAIPKTTEGTTKPKSDHKKERRLEIIDALNMPDRRRATEKPRNSDDLRRVQGRAIMAQKHENNLQNMRRKWNQGHSSGTSRKSSNEMEKVLLERKNRLHQIALAGKSDKNEDSEDPKVVNKPKIKVTEQNRGLFLTEALPCKIPARRKSMSATESRLHEKTVEEPKTSKLSSINDLGTVGKSISAFPKIPKVTKPTTQKANIKSPSIPNPESSSIAPISLTKTALKPRIARTVCEEQIKSPAVVLPTVPISTTVPMLTTVSIPTATLNQELELVPKKSILIKRRPSQNNTIKLIPKKVRFSDDINIREFPIMPNKKLLNVSEAKIKENSIAQLKKLNTPTVSLNFHPCENVINDITIWKTDWLKMPATKLPPINGSNVLLPILHTYQDCKQYEDIMIPLLKVELWRQIRNDYDMYKKFHCRANVVNGKLIPKGNGMRYEFACELQNGLDDSIRERIKEGMLLMVKAADTKFFAYMVYKDFMRTKDRQVTYITIQTTQTPVTDAIRNEMAIELTCISYIRIEVINMGFIYDLKESPLCDMILNPPVYVDVPAISDDYNLVLDCTLNDDQYNIVNYVTQECLDVAKPSIILIDGPPGTGKSFLISNLVSTLLYLPDNINLKILICSASNTAIDIIMEKLIDIRRNNKKFKNNQREIRLIRNGVIEKMSPIVQAYSIQNLCKTNYDKWKRDVESASAVSGACIATLMEERRTIELRINNLKQNGCNSSKIDDIMKLEKEKNRISSIINGNHVNWAERKNKEKQIMSDLICKADVICTTLASCVQLMRNLKSLDVCIIDEATQCTEPWSIIPLKFKIKKLILVGDTKQLPAVVLSSEAKESGLENSLFTRIQNSFQIVAETPVLSMTTQYRMHPEICEFPNKYFYDEKLKSSYKINADVPLRPYSVIGLDFMQNGNHLSVHNIDEAKFISHLLYEISKFVDLNKVQVGIITPYQQQKIEIIKALTVYNFNNIYVNTIDSFQGKEADIIILTTTRTTGTGFLGHPQRLNVALTRARHSLIICGNFIKLKHIPIWSNLVEDAQIRQVFFKFDDDFKSLLLKLRS